MLTMKCPACGSNISYEATEATTVGQCGNCGERVRLASAPKMALPVNDTPPITAAQQTSNMIAAVLSFFLPGLGQLGQGRTAAGLTLMVFFVISILLCFVLVGFILVPVVCLAAALDAVMWRPSN